MKNIIPAALIAAIALSLASCSCNQTKKPIDSTSTTVIDSNSKTTGVIDSTKTDTVKVASQKTATSKTGGALSSTSLQAEKDSIKKDSAKLSRK